jgi:hypothetical protein
MSNVERTSLVAGDTTIGEYLGLGLIGVGALAFLGSWASVFSWLDPEGVYLGLETFDLLGGLLGLLALGLAVVGIGSRSDSSNSSNPRSVCSVSFWSFIISAKSRYRS